MKNNTSSMNQPASLSFCDREISCLQYYSSYTEEDFNTWKYLAERQSKLIYEKACKEFKIGLKKLEISEDKIVEIKELSQRLKPISGWSLIGVNGLLPNEDFFHLLNNKIFPVAVHMRTIDEVEFSELPDLFHDVYGHISLLTDQSFCSFISEYSKIASKFLDNELAITFLGRLYWFTMETGLINDNGMIKAYGGAILSSSGEIENVYNEAIPKHTFDIKTAMLTSYDNLHLQKEYFVINSFDQLFNCTKELESILTDLLMESENR
jgi:phenylalanine-4-hydroxylase